MITFFEYFLSNYIDQEGIEQQCLGSRREHRDSDAEDYQVWIGDHPFDFCLYDFVVPVYCTQTVT